MNAFFTFDLFMIYIPECKQQLRTMKWYLQTRRYCTLLIWAVVFLLSESHAIINDLDVTLHGFMLQIIYATVFRVKWLDNLALHAQLIYYLFLVNTLFC